MNAMSWRVAPVVLFNLCLIFNVVACTQQPGTLPAPGTPITASGTGTSWSDPATWGGVLPIASSAVTIPAGKTVTLDQDARVASLTIDGALVAADQNLELTANWIMLHGQGKFSAGSANQPFKKRLVIQLSGTNPSEKIMGMGTKFLGVMGGTLELYGQPKRSWTRLNATALRGATQLTLLGPLSGWQVGDEIAIAPSDYNALEAEKRKITAINAQVVTLDRPLEFDHWGASPESYGSKSLDMRSEVGNLTRNIVVRSVDNQERTLPGFDPDAFDAQGRQNGDGKRLESGRFGGHMMFMPGSSVRLQNIEVTELGQQGMLGRYPVHWHLNQKCFERQFHRGLEHP
jgi:cell surface hyaluronidase